MAPVRQRCLVPAPRSGCAREQCPIPCQLSCLPAPGCHKRPRCGRAVWLEQPCCPAGLRSGRAGWLWHGGHGTAGWPWCWGGAWQVLVLGRSAGEAGKCQELCPCPCTGILRAVTAGAGCRQRRRMPGGCQEDARRMAGGWQEGEAAGASRQPSEPARLCRPGPVHLVPKSTAGQMRLASAGWALRPGTAQSSRERSPCLLPGMQGHHCTPWFTPEPTGSPRQVPSTARHVQQCPSQLVPCALARCGTGGHAQPTASLVTAPLATRHARWPPAAPGAASPVPVSCPRQGTGQKGPAQAGAPAQPRVPHRAPAPRG